eukprot:478151-Pyramimonas_sp.AAC.1
MAPRVSRRWRWSLWPLPILFPVLGAAHLEHGQGPSEATCDSCAGEASGRFPSPLRSARRRQPSWAQRSPGWRFYANERPLR